MMGNGETTTNELSTCWIGVQMLGLRGTIGSQSRLDCDAGGIVFVSVVSPMVGFCNPMDLHKLATERSLAFHRVIANRLLADPAVLERARKRVQTWLVRTPVQPF